MKQLIVAVVAGTTLLFSCAESPELEACTYDALESYFHMHDTSWNAVYQSLRRDNRVPERRDRAAIPSLGGWLPPEDSAAEGLTDLGVHSVFREQVMDRPVLFIEICRDTAAGTPVAMGYAFRLDSSAGAQDPLEPQVTNGEALSPSNPYGFRHVVASLHVYWMRLGRLDA